VGFTEVGNGLY